MLRCGSPTARKAHGHADLMRVSVSPTHPTTHSNNLTRNPIHFKATSNYPDSDHRSCDQFRVTYTPLFCRNATLGSSFVLVDHYTSTTHRDTHQPSSSNPNGEHPLPQQVSLYRRDWADETIVEV
ncbi:hypothetical protein PS1_022426 [Malus domestica]